MTFKMGTLETLFLAFVFLTIYPYIIYPLLLSVISKIFRAKINLGEDFEPNISIITPVHNEENNILPLLDSITNSGYPLSKVQFIIGSDGSTDKTNEILEKISKEYDFIEYHIFPRRGKNFVLNQLVPKAKNDIIVFIDADIRLAKGSLNKLVRYFNDENIGGVLSQINVLNLGEKDYSSKERKTQKYSEIFRKLESEIFSTVNNNGPCYAIRKELFTQIPNDKVCDDFFTLLKIITQGKRMILASDAIAYDVRKRIDIGKEFHRKMRFSAGGISAILAVPELLYHPFYILFIVSHKLLRWLSPIFTLCVIILAFFVKFQLAKIIIIPIFVLFVLLVLLGFIYHKLGGRLLKIFSYPLYIFYSLAGSIAGIFRAFLGKQNSSWTLKGLVTENEKS